MTYYPDLSSYEYTESTKSALNIGWLDVSHDYPSGTVSDDFVEKLWSFCRVAVVQTRGYHTCELCDSPPKGTPIMRHGDEVLELGSAEIRVFGRGGAVYAAPNLVYHYVVDHCYRPPDEFIQAVLEGPQPNTPEYMDQLNKCGLEPYPFHGMNETDLWKAINDLNQRRADDLGQAG